MVVTLSGTSRDTRPVWLCLHFSGSELWHTVDRTNDLLDVDRYGKCECQDVYIMRISLTSPQYAIYQSSIDYQTAAYGPYAASATGGNDLARDFLAGVAAIYSTPLYKNIPGRPVQYASTILACLAFLVTTPIYIVYWKGPEIRAKSKFAQDLDKTFDESRDRRKSSIAGVEAGEKTSEKRRERI
jgi:hypothetical protein